MASRPLQRDYRVEAPLPALSAPAYFGYGVGMVGERIFRDAPALLLLIFMTDQLGIPAAMAGLAIFVPKIAIVILDPLVGGFSDTFRSRWGRRRPLMFVGAVVTSLALIAFFHVPHLQGAPAQAAYMAVMIAIGFAGYALFSVPYLTMASEIVSTAAERTRLMAMRVAFMAVGLTIGAYAGGIVELGGGGRAGYATMSWLFAAICLVTMLISVLATGFAQARERIGEPLSLRRKLAIVTGNERFRLLLLIGFLQKLGEGIGYGSFAYFCIYVVDQPLGSMALVVLSAMTAQALSQPLWLWAGARWSPTTLYTVGVLGWCVNLGLWLLMKGQPQWLLIPIGVQAGLASGGFLTVTLAMMANGIADDSSQAGRNQEGLYSGVWLAAEKVAFAAGALIVGLLLQLSGFQEASAGARAVQSRSAVFGIAFTYCGVNALVYLSSIAVVWRYRRFEQPRPVVAASR